jgi:hypothetical protein
MEFSKFKFRLKRITKATRLYLSGPFLSNAHWCVRTDWIASLNSKTAIHLQKAIEQLQAKLVLHRLQNGQAMAMPELEGLVSNVDLSRYVTVNLSDKNCRAILGFRSMRKTKEEFLHVQLLVDDDRFGIACDYFPLLTLDPQARVLVNGPLDPIVIQKNNSIVALLMPLRLPSKE